MLYAQAIREAMDHFGDAVVMTNGYDEDIVDHYNDLEDEGPEVYVDVLDNVVDGQIWTLQPVVGEYIQTNSEPYASIISAAFHNKLKELGRA